MTFGDLVGDLRELMRGFPDKRTGRNIRYSMEDVASAAFSVFFAPEVRRFLRIKPP
ncbi:MAG: hypothetical protein L0Y38_10490 [Methylococcaceae bacterium]|nr:hypothetical protein [Methylococcaceae bacterium]MCI0734233.1 hypothetical protein [Methylococcaceae bacterium]